MQKLREADSSFYCDVLAAILIICITIIIMSFANDRQFVNSSKETDFVGGFQQEAARFIRGEKMRVAFHPPGYSVSLALVHSVIGDWFKAGLAISVAAAGALLVFNYLCFRELLNPLAGLGALAALLSVPAFFSFSIQSTSDVFFLAVYSAVLYAILLAMRRQALWLWFLVGVLISIAFLSRTNGVVVLMVLVAPFLLERNLSYKVRSVAALVLGFLLLVIAWWLYSSRTGSPFMPTKTYANLALTYMSEADRIGGDARIPLESQFTSNWDVLARDPVHVIKVYLRDLFELPRNLLTTLTWPPLALVYALCSVAWLFRLRDLRVLVVMALTCISLALTNMKAFEPRYYFFILPIAGAAVGLLISMMSKFLPSLLPARWLQGVALALFAFVSFAAFGYEGFKSAEDRGASAQLAEIIAQVLRKTPSNAALVCRKCGVAMHAERKPLLFPQMANSDELKAYLEQVGNTAPTFILIGQAERKMRPELSERLLEDPLPKWLEVSAQGDVGGRWRVIKYLGKESAD
jgi:4-amino-4-deoxy-L-arabinose transferase-like glycosyltransferase